MDVHTKGCLNEQMKTSCNECAYCSERNTLNKIHDLIIVNHISFDYICQYSHSMGELFDVYPLDIFFSFFIRFDEI